MLSGTTVTTLCSDLPLSSDAASTVLMAFTPDGGLDSYCQYLNHSTAAAPLVVLQPVSNFKMQSSHYAVNRSARPKALPSATELRTLAELPLPASLLPNSLWTCCVPSLATAL